MSPVKEDIVDELTARGDELSLRAARYIRMKRRLLRELEQDRREDATAAAIEERWKHAHGEDYGTY